MSNLENRTILNPTKRLLKQGGFSLLFSVHQTHTASIAFAAKNAGYDCLYVDLEHGTLTIPEAGQIFLAALAAGVTPLVRVPEVGTHDTQLCLDLGAMGIVAPHVHTAADAQRAVERCKFPPEGVRTNSPNPPQQLLADIPSSELHSRLNEETMVIAAIESAVGLDNVEGIAAVPGVDVLLVGTGDLCVKLGIPGQFTSNIVLKAFERIIAAGKKHGKYVCIGGGIKYAPVATLKALREMGAAQLSIGHDTAMLLGAMRQRGKEIRAVIK